MRIIMDSNVFIADFYLEGTGFRVFLSEYTKIPATIHISEVVIDEVVNKFYENLREAVEGFHKRSETIKKLIKKDVGKLITNGEIESEVNIYCVHLTSKLDIAKANILPYPEILHKDVVQYEFFRRKSFKKNGFGYRDFLLWQSVKSLLMTGSDTVAFITGDSDFGNDASIDLELQEELEKEGIDKTRLILYRSLGQFSDKIITPKLKNLESIKERLSRGALEEFNLSGWVDDNIKFLLNVASLGTYLYGLEEGVGDISVSDLDKVGTIDVESVRLLESDEIILIHASINLDIVLEEQYEVADFFLSERLPEIYDFDGSLDFVGGKKRMEIKLWFSVGLDKETYEVIFGNVDHIQNIEAGE